MHASRLSLPLAISTLLFSALPLAAQVKPTVANAYAAESFVINRSDWVYANTADGKGYREHTVAVTMQSEASLRTFAVIAVAFASASEHAEIHYARVRHKDGSVTETPVSGAIEQPEEVTRQAPFYSDLKQEQLPVRGLHVGDTLEWQARIVRTRAEAPGQFWGSESFVPDDAVTLEESIELHVPANSAATVWTNPKLGIRPKETIDGATKIYRWETTQLKPTTGPEAEAAKNAKKTKLLTPDEELSAEQGELPAVAWTNFKSWEAVGAWYRGMEGQRAVPDDEIKAKVAELIAGKTTEEEKVRAVYAYVSAQIHYIGVAFGIGRFQPHEASDVIHNQYGDCKDKATLLSAMLAAIGLPSDSVLIGEGIRWNEAVPSPAAFNHLITRVKVDGKDVWLDATQEIAPYQVLLFDLRDKPALVIPDKGPAIIASTPKDLPFPDFTTWTAKGTLNAQGVSDSQITVTMRGDEEVLLRAVTHQVAPAQYDKLAENLAKAMGYAGTVSHSEFSRPEDSADPFVFSFGYQRDRAGEWASLQLLPQMEPIDLPQVNEKEPPVQSITLGTPRTETSTAEMKLPDGWTAELPDSVHEKSPYATYDLTYRFQNGTVYTDRKIVILQRKISATEWKAYKKFTEGINLGMESYVMLHRPGDSTSRRSASTRNADSSAKVAALFQEVSDAYSRKDEKAMAAALKKIKSIDPQARRLLAWEASLANLRHKYDEAIADNEKELQLYPDEVDRYESILWTEQRKNDKAAAKKTLRTWATAQPQDPKPLLSLAQMLMAEEKYDDVIATATEAKGRAAEGSAEQEGALEMIGEGQIKSGAKDKGRDTLVALLKATQDPAMLNNCAYFLADANLELPLAETSARTAIEKLSEKTSDWTLDGTESASMKSNMSLLLASWDTMGWVLYREGKFAEAASWIEAALLNRPSAEVKLHLVKERIALEQTGVKMGDSDAGKSEQQLRTISLGPSGGRLGVAEYRLLLSHGRVESLELTGDEKLAGADALVKAADFSRFFPTGSTAKLLRTGMVNCVAGKCDLILEP